MVTNSKKFKKNGFWDFCSLAFPASFLAAILISHMSANEVRDGILIVLGVALIIFSLLFTVFGVGWSLSNHVKLGPVMTATYVFLSVVCVALFGYYLYICERKGALPIGS